MRCLIEYIWPRKSIILHIYGLILALNLQRLIIPVPSRARLSHRRR